MVMLIVVVTIVWVVVSKIVLHHLWRFIARTSEILFSSYSENFKASQTLKFPF